MTGDIVVMRARVRELVNTGTITIADWADHGEPGDLEVVINSAYTPASYYVINQGTIDGPGMLLARVYDVDPTIELGTASHVTLRNSFDATDSRTIVLATPTVCQRLIIESEHATHSTTLDLDAQTMTVNTLIIGARGAMLGGEGVIRTAAWDSSAGSWTPEDSTVVLSDGGTVKLAPGQSFNRLEISSGNGRTATWSMTATGAQAPIVTGLESGSYLWYLDGVEQGEIRADKDGTIALSYVSTGLHTLEVKPTQMTIAMDGVYQAVGIVAVLAVLGGLLTMVGRLKF